MCPVVYGGLQQAKRDIRYLEVFDFLTHGLKKRLNMIRN